MNRLLAVLLLACSSPRSAAAPAAAAAPKWPALAGAWEGGSAQTPWGPAQATLFIGPEGWGSVTVTVSGNVVSRRFRILAWDGRIASLDSEGRWDVVARLDREELVVEVPDLGLVRLRRAGAGDR